MAQGSVFRNAIGWLGLVDDGRYADEIEIEDTAEETEPVVEEPPAKPVKARQKPEPLPQPEPAPDFAGDNSQTMLLTSGIVMTPSRYDAVQPIADRYRGGLVTLMNLRAMSDAQARRSVDFFSGLVYGLNGSMKSVAERVFLMVPVGASISQEAFEEAMAEIS